MSSQMTGMKPAHEQSFDFDDYAYAQAPGSHGGGIDGENEEEFFHRASSSFRFKRIK